MQLRHDSEDRQSNRSSVQRADQPKGTSGVHGYP